MSKSTKGRRATVSLTPTVAHWADELCAKRGFENNFSAYVADLIRRDKERQEEKEKTRYPSHREDLEQIRMEDRPKRKPNQ